MPTLAFTATVDQAKALAGAFKSRGYDFRVWSYEDNTSKEAMDQRQNDMHDVKNGMINGLISVDVFSRGFDLPEIGLLILARPLRKSLETHAQQLGRGLRPCDGKEYCMVNDHTGNCEKFLASTAILWNDGASKVLTHESDGTGAAPTKACPVCMQRSPIQAQACDACGHEFPRVEEEDKIKHRTTLEEMQAPDEFATPHQMELHEQWQYNVTLMAERYPALSPEEIGKKATGQHKGMFDVWVPKNYKHPDVVKAIMDEKIDVPESFRDVWFESRVAYTKRLEKERLEKLKADVWTDE